MARQETTLLTTGQAAKLCEVTPDTILKWIGKGRLRGARTAGGHYRIDLRDLRPHIPPGRLEDSAGETPVCEPRKMYCWTFHSEGGEVRQECKECVVYRVGASQCFQMADLGTEVGAEVGHAKKFCRSSCEECQYYRRVRGLPTNVLVVTADEAILERLSTEENHSVTLRLARSAYEASAIVQEYQAAFVVVDREILVAGEERLLDSLSNDPRLPGVKIVLAVPHGTVGAQGDEIDSGVVFSVIEKPFGPRRIAAVIHSFPIEESVPVDPGRRGSSLDARTQA